MTGIWLGTAAVSLAAGMAAHRNARAWLWCTSCAATATLAGAVAGFAQEAVWEFQPALLIGGQPVHLRVDGISAFFLALLAVSGGAATVFSAEYWKDKEHPRSARSGRAWWNAMLLCMGLVLTTCNGLHFLIAWELFAVSGYFLITLERHRPEVRQAGWLYLAASHAGTMCLFAFFASLAAKTGSWALGSMRDQAGLAPLFWLALAGFGLKAGLFPLHIWLPSAHANAPSHVSALLSGVAIKMGIYGLVRFSGWMPLPAHAGMVVATIGVISAVLGVAFALGQHDLKRLLAYHSVENIGIILLGLGFAIIAAQPVGTGLGPEQAPGWALLAFAGGLLHVWNHGVFKALLFLGAGSVLHATGTRHMSSLGGLWKRMPWTASCFALGAAAISGLPPLNGFVSEWLVYLGLFGMVESRGPLAWAAVPGAILLAITGALALACFVKVVGVVFLGLPRSERAVRAHESENLMRWPMVMLAAVCVVIGVAPSVFWPALARVAGDWNPAWAGNIPVPPSLGTLGVANLVFLLLAIAGSWLLWRKARQNGIARTVTWDCGYAAPTARIQYTAGSFAGIITEWFEWILRPERQVHPPEGLFPAGAACSEHTPETVLERVVCPAGQIIMKTSTAVRRLQHGRLQSYLLYVALGLAALALLVYLGGRR